MYWLNVLLLVLSCTLANHMGLVEAIEGVIKHKIPILNCSKCASWWSVLIYSLFVGRAVIASVAVSFICAYIAVWLELLFGFIDVIHNEIYESIYAEKADDKTDTEG
jgi:hypothetical protein